MSYNWFETVLETLGEVVNFSAVVNYAGNAFVEKSWDMILDSNPMLKGVMPSASDRSIAAFFDSAKTTVVKSNGKGMGAMALFGDEGVKVNGNESVWTGDPGEGISSL